MQHLAVRTSLRINQDDKDWEKTAQGRWYSYKYGFGALDGYSYVMAAKTWKLVKPQSWFELPSVQLNNGTMDLEDKMSGGDTITREGVTSSIEVANEMLIDANLETLEHITVKVWIDHTRRGDVQVELVSPSGVKSVLAAKRRYDSAKTGFPGWKFMSLKHWWVWPSVYGDVHMLTKHIGRRTLSESGRSACPRSPRTTIPKVVSSAGR
jgi:kexin